MEDQNRFMVMTLKVSKLMCLSLTILTLMVLVGYFFQQPSFYRMIPSGPATNLTTAITLGLTALSILLQLNHYIKLSRIALLFATLLLLFKIVCFYQQIPLLAKLEDYVDHFHELYGDHKPNKMGINTVWMILMAVASVWCSYLRKYLVSQIISFSALILPAIALLGYGFNIEALYGQMSPNTIVGGVLLILVTLSTTTQHGLIQPLLAHTVSGRLARIQFIAGLIFAITLVVFAMCLHNRIDLYVLFSIELVAMFGFVLILVLSSAIAHLNVEHKRFALEKQLLHDAQYDPLTGLYNRLAFSQEVTKALLRQDRNRESICIMLIDIDYFKHVNDNHGHDVGDKVLRTIAHTIENSVRSTDIVCRYGGEEFAVVLTNLNLEQACHVAEKIRQRVYHINFSPLKESLLHVSVSIGCSTIDINNASLDQSLKWADNALYDAKHAGRNQVKVTRGITTLNHVRHKNESTLSN